MKFEFEQFSTIEDVFLYLVSVAPYMSRYSKEQFLEVSVKVCPKLSKDTTTMIGDEVFKVDGDIRDVISISKLLKKHDGPDDIRDILDTLRKYGTEVKQ